AHTNPGRVQGVGGGDGGGHGAVRGPLVVRPAVVFARDGVRHEGGGEPRIGGAYGNGAHVQPQADHVRLLHVVQFVAEGGEQLRPRLQPQFVGVVLVDDAVARLHRRRRLLEAIDDVLHARFRGGARAVDLQVTVGGGE